MFCQIYLLTKYTKKALPKGKKKKLELAEASMYVLYLEGLQLISDWNSLIF